MEEKKQTVEEMEKNLASAYKALQVQFADLQGRLQNTADELRRIEGEMRLLASFKTQGLFDKPILQVPKLVIPSGKSND